MYLRRVYLHLKGSWPPNLLLGWFHKEAFKRKLASKFVAWVVSRGDNVGEVVWRRARVYGRGTRAVYEHSEQARTPHTNGPRDVPGVGLRVHYKSRYTTGSDSQKNRF